MSISLADAIQAGVSHNLDLLSERALTRSFDARERAAWQFYSPTLVMRSGLTRERPLGPVSGRSLFSYSAGVVYQAPVGTYVSAEAGMSHELAGPSPAPNAGSVTLGVTQPLLKDGWFAGAALPLRESELQAAVQREVFRQAMNALIVEVESAYWDLAVAEADVEIKTRSRDRAQQQYEDTAENIRRGILAEVEIYVVQENVVFFEQELVQAKQNLGVARRRLAELLHVTTPEPLQPGEPLARPSFGAPRVGEVLDVGLASNPRIQAQRLRHALAKAREAYAFNQALPALDLNASLSLAGAGGTYGGAWQSTVSGTSPQAQVGVLFTLPLDRGAVGASVESATLESSRQETLLAAEEQRVKVEIENGVTELETNLELLTLTEKQVKLAELKLEAETEKYKSGISTLADVVRFQRDLDNASIRLRRVIRSVHVGRARLLASQGTLHEAFGIELK